MSFTCQGRRLPFSFDDHGDWFHILDARGGFVAELDYRNEKGAAYIAKVNAEYAEAVIRFAEDPLVGHPARDCSPELREMFEWVAQLAADPDDKQAAELLDLGLIREWKEGEYRIAHEVETAWEAWLDHTYLPSRAAHPAA